MAHFARLACGGLGIRRGVTNKHAESRFEGGDACFVIGRWNVVHGDATDTNEAFAWDLRHALVCSIAGSEVKYRSPVIGEVFREGAASAGRTFHKIVGRMVHARLKRVAPNDLVEMRRRNGAGVDQRVYAIDDELRALETHHRNHALGIHMLGEECES